ncbi:MAG: hypothetical protein K8R91_05460, partial [Phycisphaerae bacterium]|nr:hypothetical protein [Phycisphaerae bacterium]
TKPVRAKDGGRDVYRGRAGPFKREHLEERTTRWGIAQRGGAIGGFPKIERGGRSHPSHVEVDGIGRVGLRLTLIHSNIAIPMTNSKASMPEEVPESARKRKGKLWILCDFGFELLWSACFSQSINVHLAPFVLGVSI